MVSHDEEERDNAGEPLGPSARNDNLRVYSMALLLLIRWNRRPIDNLPRRVAGLASGDSHVGLLIEVASLKK